MFKAIIRADSDSEPSYGFLYEEPAALTVVIVITDEVDCSYNPSFDSIFLNNGDKFFWEDPTQSTPTSAVCWNAGVACSGSGTYDECHSANFDPLGAGVPESEAESEAVLRPVSRYLELLARRPTLVFGIVGVPLGYSPSTPIPYRDSPNGSDNDPYFQDNYGIGPGCISPVTQAVPPVRLREVVEGAQGGGLFSVCETDYGPTFTSIAEQIVARLDQPA
jgi:hypothetical protein